MEPRYLYLHVPFCARRCSYCDFAVDVAREPPTAAWLKAIGLELDKVVRSAGWRVPLELETIYVGGGTPSLLGCGTMGRLAELLRRFARWDESVEWTAEANPESLDSRLARDWRDVGVNRVSLGVQSFDERVLRWMGRLHGADGAVRAVAAARGAGITNLSIDLIFGLPRRLGRSWSADLDRALSLDPEHISLYGLTAEPRTPLGQWVGSGREVLADESEYAEEYLHAAERLRAEGYEHYEVSNFARPGRESRHNGAYWTGAPYLGLGPSAHSYDPPERRWNVREWSAYRNALEAGRDAVAEREVVDAAATQLERIWLGLRVSRGIALDGLSEAQRRAVEAWRRQGWCEIGSARVSLTPSGWLLLDRLTVELDALGARAA